MEHTINITIERAISHECNGFDSCPNLHEHIQAMAVLGREYGSSPWSCPICGGHRQITGSALHLIDAHACDSVQVFELVEGRFRTWPDKIEFTGRRPPDAIPVTNYGGRVNMVTSPRRLVAAGY